MLVLTVRRVCAKSGVAQQARNGEHLFGMLVVATIQAQPSRCRLYSTILPVAITVPTDVPFAFRLQTLRDRLQALVDQRDPRGVRYPLAAMLTIAVLAKLSGASRVEALADWAWLRAPDLAQMFGLARPTMPHARTWGRIFARRSTHAL